MTTGRLLVIGGGLDGEVVVRRAQALGFHVICVDRNVLAPGMLAADSRFVADCYAEDLHVQVLADTTPCDGVLAVGVDVPHVAGMIAAAWGLLTPPLGPAATSIDKWRTAQVLGPLAPPTRLVEHMSIVKPRVGHGSQGLELVEPGVLQEFVDGPQLSIEGVAIESECIACGTADRHYAGVGAEVGGVIPSTLSPSVVATAEQTACEAARLMGARNTTWKADVIVGVDGPLVCEIAVGRISGGMFGCKMIPLATGIDFPLLAIKLAVGILVSHEECTPTIHRRVVARMCRGRKSIWVVGGGDDGERC
jgi:hypothetical protein